MKKLITFRAAVMLLLAVVGISKASAEKWIGGSAIYVNGTWYYATWHGTTESWCTGGAFDGANIGAIASLRIGGQTQIWETGNIDWKGGGNVIMGYKIDGGTAQNLTLSSKGFENNNNVYQLGGKDLSPFTIDISGLSAGSHTIEVWFGETNDNLWDSNNTANYKATFYTSEEITVTSVSYATYVSSLPLDYTDTDIKAYTAKVNTSTGVVTLSQINKVPANTPVVLYKDGGATENVPVCFSDTDTPEESDLVAGTGEAIATTDGTNYNYILNNVSGIGFYKAAGQTVATNRAYLHTTYNVAAAARMVMVFADEAAGITNNLRETADTNRYFDLQGRSVAQPKSGLYIVNGKKVIIK